MKKFYILTLLLVGTLSYGQTILYEGFNYSTPGYIGGNLGTTTDAVGSNNWATHSNTSTNTGTIDVIAGSLSYPGIYPSTGNKVLLPGNNTAVPRDINRGFTGSGTVMFYSVLINVIDNTQLSATTPSYFMGFGTASGASAGNFGGRLAIASSNTGANYRLSIQNTSTGTPTFTDFNQDLVFGTTYLVVVKYDAGTSPTTASLWVNPASLGGAEPAATAVNNSGTAAFTAFASVFLRNNATTPKVEIDEIKVGATWADVTSAVLGVKQNAIAGLSIYPNPVSNGTLFIDTNANAEKKVVVYNVLGKQVLSTTISGNSINVGNLNSGVYIVKVTEEGKTATRKLVIR